LLIRQRWSESFRWLTYFVTPSQNSAIINQYRDLSWIMIDNQSCYWLESHILFTFLIRSRNATVTIRRLPLNHYQSNDLSCCSFVYVYVCVCVCVYV
jgi:hypothetical protein